LFYPMRAPLWVPHFPMFYTDAMQASTRFVIFFCFLLLSSPLVIPSDTPPLGAPDLWSSTLGLRGRQLLSPVF
jgi:hypothetical protein